MTSYRNNILSLMKSLLKGIECDSALDFGCGDGWFATHLPGVVKARNVSPLDVKRRENCAVEPIVYSGESIPFDDRHFDLVYSIDVLHHCAAPDHSLRELIRCTDRYLLIKDHNFSNVLGWMALCALDEIGNRRFGIPSPYHYQKDWSWVDLIESSGMRRLAFLAPAQVHDGPLGTATNRLQFIGLWERVSAQ